MEEIITVDDRGRIIIPSRIRKMLNLKKGSKLKVKVVNRDIVLEYVLPKVRKVRANRKWGRETFLDAGEATFGEY